MPVKTEPEFFGLVVKVLTESCPSGTILTSLLKALWTGSWMYTLPVLVLPARSYKLTELIGPRFKPLGLLPQIRSRTIKSPLFPAGKRNKYCPMTYTTTHWSHKTLNSFRALSWFGELSLTLKRSHVPHRAVMSVNRAYGRERALGWESVLNPDRSCSFLFNMLMSQLCYSTCEEGQVGAVEGKLAISRWLAISQVDVRCMSYPTYPCRCRTTFLENSRRR